MLNETYSYIYGLIITDGSIYLTTRNRGRIQIELKYNDKDILEKIQKIIPNCHMTERYRNTNFKQNSHTVILSNYQKQFRDNLINYGIPTNLKSINARPPIVPYDTTAFWRGVIDGNGSLGFTKQGIPYVSLVTKSETIKTKYCQWLYQHFNIIKHINPNTRDHVYNITITREDAMRVSYSLYKNSNLHLNRKYNAAQQIQQWKRSKPTHPRQMWTVYELNFIQTHSVQESIQTLHRTEQSIRMKLWRLSKVTH